MVDDEGDADAAFIEGAFAGAERRVAGDANATMFVDVSAVVGGEDDEGVVGEVALFEFGEDSADALVEAVVHGGVVGVAVVHAGFDFLLVMGDEVGFAFDGGVDGVIAHVEEERPVGSAVDEVEGLVGEPIGEIVAFFGEWQVRDVSHFVSAAEGSGEGVVEGGGASPERPADVEIEAVVLWVIGSIAQMPLANVCGEVSGVVKDLGNGDFGLGQIGNRVRGKKRAIQDIVGGGLSPDGHVEFGGGLSGHDGGPGGGADGRSSVGVGEFHAAGDEAVDVGGFVEIAAVASGAGPTHVVDEEHDDVEGAIGGAGGDGG